MPWNVGSVLFAAMPSSPHAAPVAEPHILVIPKWWPNARDPQLGDFLRKQVQALALTTKVTVLLVEAEQHTGTHHMEADGLQVVRGNYKASTSRLTAWRKLVNLAGYWRAAMAGWRIVVAERGKPDLVHVHILARPALIARWIKLRHGIPYLLSEQSSVYLDGTYQRRGALFHLVNRWLFSGAASITAVSTWLGERLVELGLCTRYEVVPNVIPGLDRPLPLPGPIGRFMVVADLVDRTKNVSGVIRALANVVSRGADARLTIIGDGPDRATLEAMAEHEGISERITFLGQLPNTGVLDHMAHTWAVIINSNVETFSVVTGEALAQGKPVIATRCGGPQGFVTEENGLLIPVDNSSALADAMLALMADAAHYDGARIRASVHAKFSPAAVGQAFLQIQLRSLGARK